MVTLFFLSVLVLSGLAFASSAYILVLAAIGLFLPPIESVRVDPGRTKFLIFIPAHNEELGIITTLQSIRTLNYPAELQRVVVIADNCTDQTATIVRNAGVECWERNVPKVRGKGQALRWALNLVEESDFEALVVIDADSRVHSELLNSFATALEGGAHAVQARYDFKSDASNFVAASTVLGKNAESTLFWRPRHRLGLAVFLQGNGFCLTRNTLRQLPWSAYSIVEDIEYSLNLARNGIRVSFLETANVVAHAVESTVSATPQRVRWASGTFDQVFRTAPRVALAGVRRGSFFLLETGFALVLLSRMVLIYLTGVALVCSFLLPHSHARLIQAMVTATVAIQFLYLLCAVRANMQDTPAWKSLVFIPRYLCWLVVAQGLALLRHRRQIWTRTPR